MIRIIQGNIAKVDNVEAIVNAANKRLWGGSGVDGAIHKAAGPRLLMECLTLGGCETGEAKITKAYKLPCKHVIHTVGPVWKGGKHNEEQLLASCYIKSLDLAAQNNIRSIAFPSIATGAHKFPVDRAAQIAISTVKKYVSEHQGMFDDIVFVLFDEATKAVYDGVNI